MLELKSSAKFSGTAPILVSEATICDVKDISGTKIGYSEYPCDIGLQLKLDIGKSFNPTMKIFGTFKKDKETGKILDWGGAFVVRELLVKLGVDGTLTSDEKLQPGTIEKLKGKKILRLSYLSGRKETGAPRYSDWNQIALPEEKKETLIAKFNMSVSQGYPKNFHPEIADSDDGFPPVTLYAGQLKDNAKISGLRV